MNCACAAAGKVYFTVQVWSKSPPHIFPYMLMLPDTPGTDDLQHKVILVTQSMKMVEKSFSLLFISYDTHDNIHR